MSRVVVTDPQALNHILSAPEIGKSKESRRFFGELLGKGWSSFFLASPALANIVVYRPTSCRR